MTTAEIRFLYSALRHNDQFDWALTTGGAHRRRTARRLFDAGLVREELCALVDGDGYTLGKTERWTTGYRITAAGRHALARREHERTVR